MQGIKKITLLTGSINKDKKLYEFKRVKDSMEFERIADK
jgi:hypothetical protein